MIYVLTFINKMFSYILQCTLDNILAEKQDWLYNINVRKLKEYIGYF